MGNLIRAELYKASRHRVTLILLLAVCVAAPLTVVIGVNWGVRFGAALDLGKEVQTAAETFCTGMTAGVYLAFPLASVVFSDQYKYGTLKNEAVFGICRTESYFSRLGAGLLLGLGYAGVCILSFVLPAFLLLPGRSELPGVMLQFAPQLLMAVPMWLASGAIALGLFFLFRSSGMASICYMLYFTVGFVVIAVLGVAWSGELEAGRGGIPVQILAFLCEVHPLNMLWETVVDINVTGISFQVQMAEGAGIWFRVLRSWLVGLGWVAVSTLAAVLSLHRKELR